MTELKTSKDARAVAGSRRSFMAGGLSLLALATAPGCGAAPAPAPALALTSTQPPEQHRRSRGEARISVRETGAHGDGVHDDTAAFQRAIDALPHEGGTVEVPPGRYLIDPVVSVRPRSRMHLELADDATLVAKPNDQERAYVLYVFRVEDVEISGGRIVGDRASHLGTTGEWGHGIQVRGASRVTVRDMHISDCWGDGICAGPAQADKRSGEPKTFSDDVAIARVVCTNNRRQGLSIGGCRNVEVHDSEFSSTHGTAPECGIDIEPDPPDWASNIRIRNCLLRDNAKYGILVFERTRDVGIEGCTIEDNRSCGIVTVGAHGVLIADNTIRNNGSTGVFIKEGSTDIVLRQNTFHNNYAQQDPPAREPFSMVGHNRQIQREILVSEAASDVLVATNHYR